jgi:signal transduction histidine kinase
MTLRTKLLLAFLSMALLVVVVFGLVAYRIAQDSEVRREAELLADIARMQAESFFFTPGLVLPDRSGHGKSSTISDDPGLVRIIVDKSGRVVSGPLPGSDAAMISLPIKLEDLIASGKTTGISDFKNKKIVWALASIPNSTYSIFVAHYTRHRAVALRETLGSRLLVTGMVVIWLAVWGALVVSAIIAKRLNQKHMELLQANQQLKAEMDERNRAEESARVALTEKLQAEASSKAKGSFLANMSHELRTPLNAILGYSEILIEDVVKTEHHDWAKDLRMIQASGKHLLALINEVLDMSKIEAGKMEFHLQDFDVKTMLQDILGSIEPLVMKNNNQIEAEWDGELGQMFADHTKMWQMLLNLLSNACKFTHDGTIKIFCQRFSQGGREWLVFKVTDTGIGMDQQALLRLFEPFMQADSSTTRKYGGTGLGLAITKRFAEMAGGEISVESVPTQGTTFTIRVPAIWSAENMEAVSVPLLEPGVGH